MCLKDILKKMKEITTEWKDNVRKWNEDKVGKKIIHENFYSKIQTSCPYWLALDIHLNVWYYRNSKRSKEKWIEDIKKSVWYLQPPSLTTQNKEDLTKNLTNS